MQDIPVRGIILRIPYNDCKKFAYILPNEWVYLCVCLPSNWGGKSLQS